MCLSGFGLGIHSFSVSLSSFFILVSFEPRVCQSCLYSQRTDSQICYLQYSIFLFQCFLLCFLDMSYHQLDSSLICYCFSKFLNCIIKTFNSVLSYFIICSLELYVSPQNYLQYVRLPLELYAVYVQAFAFIFIEFYDDFLKKISFFSFIL